MKSILLLAALVGAVATNTVSAAPVSAKVNLSAEIEISTCAIGVTTLDLGSVLSTGTASKLKLGDVSDLDLLTNCTPGEAISLRFPSLSYFAGLSGTYHSVYAPNTGSSAFNGIVIGNTDLSNSTVSTASVNIKTPADGNIKFKHLSHHNDIAGSGAITYYDAEVHALNLNNSTSTRNEQNGTIRGVIPITIVYQ